MYDSDAHTMGPLRFHQMPCSRAPVYWATAVWFFFFSNGFSPALQKWNKLAHVKHFIRSVLLQETGIVFRKEFRERQNSRPPAWRPPHAVVMRPGLSTETDRLIHQQSPFQDAGRAISHGSGRPRPPSLPKGWHLPNKKSLLPCPAGIG